MFYRLKLNHNRYEVSLSFNPFIVLLVLLI
nr:MAG TPA: hypothetical protein [Caudoviricetes sp.]DAS56701.1 MAG TPA: hypothetical protein [Caudoviricetes sp.]